ncbi:hypothetical protein NQD34_017128, partial [Periophthalmus magnuspinnatus]
RAKFPSLKPPDYLTLERRKQEAERENFAEFTKYQQSWELKNSWIKSSDRNYVRSATERQVKAAIDQFELGTEERRERLRIMLETEEQQFLKEMEERRETTLDRQAKMRERAKVLRDIRETKRQEIVSEKMEQLFINQCEELRTVLTKRRGQETRLDCAAQVRSKQEQQQEQQMKDRQFAEMWEAIHQREEEKESERIERQQQKTNEHLTHLRAQIDAAEQQKQQAKVLKEEEAQLLQEHIEMVKLQEQREKHQKLKAQQTRRRQLDQSYRMKMRRLAKEQQEELALDMSILQQVLSQESERGEEAAQRKIEMREEQQRYRQYLADELERQKQLERETEQLFEEKLRETWDKREKQSQMERDARNRLMNDVLEARSLQIQHKLELNKQKQDQLARDREELLQMTEKVKLLDQEEKRRHKELCQAYQADLQAQMQHKQQLKRNEKALEEREFQYGLAVQQEYENMKERILSRPTSHTTVAHPFRRTEGAKSVPPQRRQ